MIHDARPIRMSRPTTKISDRRWEKSQSVNGASEFLLRNESEKHKKRIYVMLA